ncbi:transcriptional regulator [Latilactobacillus curvatus]|uniref:Transcriptional regulator n=1 Tax=Latilactobacillus curvatus TaxID=28038 RepID=A0AAC9Y0Q3_LATCU|nr:helix-turn-helix transcriptional regulator [Latilactobacillus curvatus]ASN59791.1 transcriptional regulator [Latilactobacillus curvatus]
MGNLSIERNKLGLTQVEAAKAIGVSYSTLTKLETNQKNASKETMEKFSEFYKKPVDYLFFGNFVH